METVFYWLSRGLEEKWGYKLKGVENDVLILVNGSNILAVKVLLMDVYNEADVAKGVAEMADAKQYYDKVYLAVPTDALAYVDAKLLKRLGVGLIAFDLSRLSDEGSIEEKLPARSSPRRRVELNESSLAVAVEELVRRSLDKVLSSKLAELEARLRRYVDERVSEVARARPPAPQPSPPSAPEAPTAELRDLPEFIRGNQWVQIIQGRRR